MDEFECFVPTWIWPEWMQAPDDQDFPHLRRVNISNAWNDWFQLIKVCSYILEINSLHQANNLNYLFIIFPCNSEWVPHTEAASLYIRPTLIGIEPTLGVASSDSALLYTILSPVGGYFKPGASSMGISLLADPQYVRAWPGGVGDRKVGSNYGPTIQIQKEAAAQGLNQILWLYGEDRQVTEAGTMNMFMLIVNDQGGELIGRKAHIAIMYLRNLTIFLYYLHRTWTRHTSTQRYHSSWHHTRLNSPSRKRMATIQNIGANFHNEWRPTAAVRGQGEFEINRKCLWMFRNFEFSHFSCSKCLELELHVSCHPLNGYFIWVKIWWFHRSNTASQSGRTS